MINAPTLRDVRLVHVDPLGEDMLRMLRDDPRAACVLHRLVLERLNDQPPSRTHRVPRRLPSTDPGGQVRVISGTG